MFVDKHSSEFVLGLKMEVRKAENKNNNKYKKHSHVSGELSGTINDLLIFCEYYIFVLPEVYHQINETATYSSVL